MEDVLAVYARPYDARYPVICADESNKVLHAETRAPQGPQPGQPGRVDDSYEPAGTVNLFLFTEPLRGWRRVAVTERRTGLDFAAQLRQLVEEDYPAAERIVLVVDNLNTHHPGVLYEAFPAEQARQIAERLEWHYTPKHGSWLNMAEIELSALAQQCLDRRFPDRDTLQNEAAAWEAVRNAEEVVIDWRFTTEDARIKLKHLYPSIHS